MRDEDKPFVAYKRGWSFKIVPRGAAGWRALALWMVPFAIMVVVLMVAIEAIGDSPAQFALMIGFIALNAVWAILMIRWMLARSERVDLDEMLDLKRQRDRESRRR